VILLWVAGCPQGVEPFFSGGAFPGAECEECVREHGEGDMPVPGVVEPDLVLVEADFTFPCFEAFFSRPPLMPVKKKSSLAFRVRPGRY
jgi:hypothetical protein